MRVWGVFIVYAAAWWFFLAAPSAAAVLKLGDGPRGGPGGVASGGLPNCLLGPDLAGERVALSLRLLLNELSRLPTCCAELMVADAEE